MRLGQLARKYDIPVQEIIDYLEEHTGERFHANAKVYDTLESKIFLHFELIPEVSENEDAVKESTNLTGVSEEVSTDLIPNDSLDQIDQKKELATPEEEIAAIEGEILELPSKEEVAQELEKVPSEDEIIQTDKLLEMLESEEAAADLDKIKLIKAPKKELSGLKVVGKVDLPEPKKKEEKPKEIVTEKDLREYRYPQKKKRQPLTEEEKEKRRLKARKKKEAYEARKEKVKKEQEEQKKKARRQEHYKQKLEHAKAVKVKRTAKEQPSKTSEAISKAKSEPKTVLGKFWRWLNT